MNPDRLARKKKREDLLPLLGNLQRIREKCREEEEGLVMGTAESA
jgi:hypothetical protein